MSGEKIFETMVFIVLIMIIGVLMFPLFEKIVYNTQESIAKSNVNGVIDTVKNVYINENQKLDNMVYLPFMVEFNKDGYKTFCDGNQVNIKTKIDVGRNKPLSGTVTWSKDNNIIVTNLKFKDHVCNKSANGQVECKRNSE